MNDQILVCRESFAANYNGAPIVVQKGERVRDGHELVKNHPDKFEPADVSVRFDLEQATTSPGPTRQGRRKAKKPAAKKPAAEVTEEEVVLPAGAEVKPVADETASADEKPADPKE